ncbi:serine/threonine-protein kinase [Streptomyces sp. NBC_00083]|uniref:serine/threonine-protein kinase n=1 Tax=Streptomyces sp. NBC_00083 TaxID=2975647 RepID=UPI00224CC6BC|nr:serine/threonine-protein kinase [Streptomyces sp. NBC_00083]MCX5384946.1 serine/threonine protein kinase [Streptomyces sp. NBC_00083]
MQPLEAGEPHTIGSYRLLGRLGAGGMGRVYLGRSAGGRTVAVKVVHPHFALDEQFRARFRHEVEAARRVGGQWTAPVLDADPEAPVPWVATGYVAGPSLTQAVMDRGPLPERSVRALGAGLAEALAAVHALGLVHRDVKPSNVLLTLDGPRLIDFGIARATDGTASLTASGVSIGSPGYMSPEQILGRGVTGAADLFSLGAVLAYAATGEPPFPGDSSAALLYKVVHEPPELGAALTGEVRDAVASCLAKDPADRPAPTALASRLAPAGAADLVRGGWLPGPLVEDVSRSAVRLLDLEPRDTLSGSGPIPFSSPAIGGAAGTFGPPDASYGPADPDGPAGAGSYGRADAHAYGHPEPPSTGPAERGPRVALSLATESEPGERGRGRRVSCTVALAVAGALATVTLGAAFLYDVLPGSGGGSHNSGAQHASSAPATGSHAPDPAGPAPASPSEGGQLPSVPGEFTGTWKGVLAQDNGTSGYEYTAVITRGAKGTDVVHTTTTVGPLQCHGVGVLDSATARVLHITERTDPSEPSTFGCTGATATMTYTLQADGTLRFVSQEAAAGRPTGTLSRQ